MDGDHRKAWSLFENRPATERTTSPASDRAEQAKQASVATPARPSLRDGQERAG
jgi:hypothetical protein